VSTLSDLNKKIEIASSSSFKNQRRKNRRLSLGRKKKNIAIDDFGNPYRAISEENKTEIVNITLPKALVKLIDENRKKIKRSRYIREIIETALDVDDEDKIIDVD
jgi:EAL domain-containing protein (putative c-di-GMP-specific phosphodiesterase class I)